MTRHGNALRKGIYCTPEKTMVMPSKIQIVHGAVTILAGLSAAALLFSYGSTGAALVGVLWAAAAYAALEAVIEARGLRPEKSEDISASPPEDTEAEEEPVPQESDEGSVLALPKKWMAFRERVVAEARKIDADGKVDIKKGASAFLDIVKEYEELIGIYGDILPAEEKEGILATIKDYTAKLADLNASEDAEKAEDDT